MSKVTDSKQRLMQYIHDTLAENVLLRPIKKGQVDTLPPNILSIFTFYEAEMLGKNVVLAFEDDRDAVSHSRMGEFCHEALFVKAIRLEV